MKISNNQHIPDNLPLTADNVPALLLLAYSTSCSRNQTKAAALAQEALTGDDKATRTVPKVLAKLALSTFSELQPLELE